MNPKLRQYTHPMQYLLFDEDGGAGSGGGGGTDGSSDGTTDSGSGTGTDGKTFSQQDVNAAASSARKEGREAAAKSLADELGVPLDQAKTLIKAALDKEESEKSEAQKAREAADREKGEAEAAKQEAAKRIHNADVRDALRDAGVAKERLAKVATLVDVEVGADEAAITKAVDATKKEFPELFGGTSGAPDSDTGGTSGANGGTGAKSSMEAGYERAQRDFGGSGSGEHPLLAKK